MQSELRPKLFHSQPAKTGAPNFAQAQRDAILALLREAKLRGEGVDRAHLVFECRFTQCAARIFELERIGYEIRHETRPGQRYITYILESEPAQEKPLPAYQPMGPDKRQGVFSASPDWYERQAEQPRPSSSPSVEDLPLFEGTRP